MRGIQSNQGLTTNALALGSHGGGGGGGGVGGGKHHDKQPADIAGATDTLYLCNFRVSVDGDWLCLKELADIDDAGAAHEGGNSGKAVVANHKDTNNQYENDKCVEKVVERDWVNYYCRCLVFSSFISDPASPPLPPL